MRAVLTAEHTEPWNGNLVDLKMADGTHRVGLLRRVDATWVRISTPREGTKAVPDELVRIADAVSIMRAGRN
jgi:hypothetical protein